MSADSVGGSEQVVAALDRALTSAGHHSIVIAAEGSKVEGVLIASPRAPQRLDDSVREKGRDAHRSLIKEAIARYSPDLVHMHSLDFHCYLPPEEVPTLATLHLPPYWYPQEIFTLKRPNFYLNCVSRTQHGSCPSSLHLLPPVTNGIDVGRLKECMCKRQFALALGRICPEKGFHFALDAARQSGTDLLLAGDVFPYDSHIDYFQSEIIPRLDDRRRFIGPLRFSQKSRLLARAKCVLIPSTVAETSSLVAMEALSCGTPVIAFRSGALPEIVEHGSTGFIVSNVDQMADALRQVQSLRPSDCRKAAVLRFSAKLMAAKYMRTYERLIETSVRTQACFN